MKRFREKGIVLPSVFLLMLIALIFTTTVVVLVDAESKQSIRVEHQTKAYYLARSAVEVTSKAMIDEINELNSLKTILDNSLEVYNLNPNNANDLTDYNKYIDALTAYNDKLYFIDNNVFPIMTTNSYVHVVHGVADDLGDIQTKVEPVTGAYKISAEAKIHNVVANVSLNMQINTSSVNQILKKHVTSTNMTDIEETTLVTIPSNNPASFANALYSFGDLNLDNNNDFKKPNNSAAPVKYRANIGGKQKNNSGIFSHDTATSQPLDPKKLLPLNIDEDIRFKDILPGSLPNTLTTANNGYYSNVTIPNNSNYNIDTTQGNVVIKLNRLEFDNSADFHVIGPNYFYIYIEDNSLSDGGLVLLGNNNITFSSDDNKPRTFILVDHAVVDRTSDNDIYVKNNLDLKGYIYAPYSQLEFKNNPIIVGSLVADDIDLKNNVVITHVPPSEGSYQDDGSGNQTITVITKKTEYVNTTTIIETIEPISIIPVSIRRYWNDN